MGKRPPRVTVCIPLYNGERYLPQCIDSVLAQTYIDFELLLVDDGSSDQTVAIAQAYASRDSRVHVSTNRANLGMVQNWNRCIELAKGEWIKFVFQDDAIEPHCLVRMLDRADAGVLLVACQRSIVFDDGIEPRVREWYEENRAMLAAMFSAHQLVSAECCQRRALDRFGINLFGEPSAVMVHRTAFERFGLFNPALIIACDLEFWTRVSIHAGAAFVPEDLAMFRVHKQAASAVNHSQREFRTNVLDNLVILHQYAFDDLYRPIRQAAARRSPPLALTRLFKQRCHEVRAKADWARRHPTHPDPSLMAEWQDVVKRYPRIAQHEALHVAWRLRQRLLPFARLPLPSNAKDFLR